MPENEAPKRVLGTPRGTKDMGFREAIAMSEVLSVIEETFKRFGFSPIDTPAIESMDVMNAKAYGDEQTKEIYVLESKDAGLRYDLTVPLARYMAMNKDLALPFKRYQIGKVWRKDEPQYMRSREFMQADIDIVGSSETESEAEVIAAAAAALDLLGMTKYTIFINHREMLNAILTSFGIPNEKQVACIRIIDKLAKQSIDDTTSQIAAAGVARQDAEKLLAFLTEKTSNEDRLNRLASNSAVNKQHIDEMAKLLSLLKKYGIKGDVRIDFSLARGLDYYTGFVWEFVPFEDGKRLPSVASGGRYDNLISMFSKNKTPAVGTSLGVSRILELLKDKASIRSYVRTYVAQIGDENKEYALGVCKELRANGIYTDINVTKRGISKQLEYANSIGARFVVVVGNQERNSNKAKLRDMETGKEELLDLGALLSKLKGE